MVREVHLPEDLLGSDFDDFLGVLGEECRHEKMKVEEAAIL